MRWFLQRSLSRLVGRICESRLGWIKNPLIRAFIYWYNIDLNLFVKSHIRDYTSVNDFFLRQLNLNLRALTLKSHTLLSPVDGCISQMGSIEGHTLLQAKGKTYTLQELLADDSEKVDLFRSGDFITLYLAPQDYHRVHMPLAGTLQHVTYVPGSLFSVNARNTRRIKRLFTRNERAISVFETDIGPMAIVQVGAFLVGNIGTVWQGTIMPASNRPKIDHWTYHGQNYYLDQTKEMGYFKFGSTVILLVPKGQICWDTSLHIGKKLWYGQALGILQKAVVSTTTQPF